jgi:putative transposase
MLTIFWVLFSALRSFLRSRAALHAEILALRHQLLVLQRSTRDRPLRLRAVDRIFWVWLSRLWPVPIKNSVRTELIELIGPSL